MREKQKENTTSFMRGVLTLLLAQMIVKLLGVVYRLVMTNIPEFGDKGNGLYGAGYHVYMILLAISSMGVPSAIAKLVSEKLAIGKRKEAEMIFHVAFVLFSGIGLFLSVLLWGSAGIIAETMGNSEMKGILQVLAPAVFFVAVASVIRGYFHGIYCMKASSYSQIVEQFFKSVLTVVMVELVASTTVWQSPWLKSITFLSAKDQTTAMAIAGNFASTVATGIGCLFLGIYYIVYRRKTKETYPKVKLSFSVFREIIPKILVISIPITIASVVSAINRNIDTFTVVNLLKNALQQCGATLEMATEEATRLYGILAGKIDILMGLPFALNMAFATALVPSVAGALANGAIQTAKRRITFSFRMTLLIAIPCMIGACMLAEPILHLLFPNADASEASLLLQISSLTMLGSMLNQTIGGSLQGIGKAHIPALSIALGAVVKWSFNQWLIPKLEWGMLGGINGASISSVISATFTCFLNFGMLQKYCKISLPFMQTIGKPVILSLLAGGLARYLHAILRNYISANGAIILAIGCAMLVYGGGLFFLRVLQKEEYEMIPYGHHIYVFLSKWKLVKP